MKTEANGFFLIFNFLSFSLSQVRTAETPREAETQHSAASKSPFRSQQIPHSLIRILQPANPRSSTLSSAFRSQQILNSVSFSGFLSLSLTVLQARLLCVSVFAGCENSLTVWTLDRGSLHHPLSFSISPLLHPSFSYGKISYPISLSNSIPLTSTIPPSFCLNPPTLCYLSPRSPSTFSLLITIFLYPGLSSHSSLFLP